MATYAQTYETDFDFPQNTSYEYPSSLVQAADGNFYGTTASTEAPIFYKVTPTGTFTTIYTFQERTTGIIQGGDGSFYGTIFSGGAYGNGYVFRITSGGAFTDLYDFCPSPNFDGSCPDGAQPQSVLVQGSDGNFYGTTSSAGVASDDPNPYSTIFKITSTGSLTVLADSSYALPTNGLPAYSVLQASDGNFYGPGFKMTPAGAITETASAGGAPGPTLTEGKDGALYGTTPNAVSGCSEDEGCGTVYRLTLPSESAPSGTVSTIYTFSAYEDIPALTPGTDGNLYIPAGSFYELTPPSTFTQLDVTSGANTQAIVGSDGNLYVTDAPDGVEGGSISRFTPATPMPSPVQLTLGSSSIQIGSSTTLVWKVLNAFSTTMQQCYEFSTSNGVTTALGKLTGTYANGIYSGSVMVEPASDGSYLYAVTCGGVESGYATLTVSGSLPITFTSVSHNFGTESVGAAAAAYGITVKNTGTTAYPFTLNFTAAHGFTSATNCGSKISAGTSCELAFYFTPTGAGTVTEAWSLQTETGATYSPSNGGTLTGTGVTVGAVTLTTNGHNFLTQAVDTTSGTYGTVLTNSTNEAVTLTLGSVTSPFSSLTNCGATLAPGASCNLEFTFKPVAKGIAQQTYETTAKQGGIAVSITANGVVSTGIKLTGTGD